MRVLIAFTLAFCFAGSTVLADDKVEAKGDKVDYKAYVGSYFVKNTYEMKGDSAYVTIPDKDGFEKIFGPGRVIGKQEFLPNDAFDKKMVIAAIKKGAAVTEYKVEKVTQDGDTVYVQYTTSAKGSATGTASFTSPMIVTVDKEKVKKVVFIENGKKADTVDVPKGS
jgi:hypothetical protein